MRSFMRELEMRAVNSANGKSENRNSISHVNSDRRRVPD